MAEPSLARRPWEPATLLIGIMVMLFALVPASTTPPRLPQLGHPAMLVSLALFVAWVLSRLHRGLLPQGAQPMRWLVWLGLTAELAVYAADLAQGMTRLEEQAAIWAFLGSLGIAGVVLAMADGVRSRERLTGVVGIVLLGGGIIATAQLAQQITPLRVPGIDPGELGLLIAALLPFSVHMGRFAPSRPARQWSALGGALMLAGLATALSRSALVSLGIALLVLIAAWSWRTRFNLLVPAALVAIGLACIVPGSLDVVWGLLASPQPWLHPLTGHALVQAGTLAALSLGAILLAAIAARRSAVPADRHLCVCLIACQLSAIAIGLTHDPFALHHYQFFVAIMTGAAAAMWRLSPPRAGEA